jgi:phospholipid-binding lipoprotein MlaA
MLGLIKGVAASAAKRRASYLAGMLVLAAHVCSAAIDPGAPHERPPSTARATSISESITRLATYDLHPRSTTVPRQEPANDDRRVQASEGAPRVEREPDPLFDDDYDSALDGKPAGFPDPLEPVNRGFLRVNRVLDRLVLDPVTKFYDLVVPESVEPAIRRSFRHFASTSILLNDLLQVHPRSTGRTAVRLIVNSTVGVAGLFDFARCNGYYRHGADFGQTLWHYGVGSGPYFVLPVFGPSNLRDAFGDLVDGLLHPALYLLGPAEQLTYGSGYGLAAREEHYKSLEALEDSAVDFYAALRNAYYQVRQAELTAGTNPGRPKEDEYDGRCTRTLSSDPGVAPDAPRGGGYVAPVSRWNRF